MFEPTRPAPQMITFMTRSSPRSRAWHSTLGPARAFGGADAERTQLAVQGRALHADEGGGARNIAAEARHLRVEIPALEHLARLAQRQRHDFSAVAVAQRRRRDAPHVPPPDFR